jgi:hypothetical protein
MYNVGAPLARDTGGDIYQLLALYNAMRQQQQPQYNYSTGPGVNPIQMYGLYQKLAGAGGAAPAATPAASGGMTGVTAAPAPGG